MCSWCHPQPQQSKQGRISIFRVPLVHSPPAHPPSRLHTSTHGDPGVICLCPFTSVSTISSPALGSGLRFLPWPCSSD